MLSRNRRRQPSGTEHRYAVCTGSVLPIRSPLRVYGNGKDKNKTVFVLESADYQFQMLGTYEEFMELAAEIMNRMYSWALENGRSDWFDAPETQEMTEVIANGYEGIDRTN